jgi:tellurium resistance protein TerD
MVNLQAGANISLTKTNPLLEDIVVGFGWNLVNSNGLQPELVPSAIITDAGNEALSDEHFVFFNQLATPDDAVRYVDGDDSEQIELSLSRIPADVAKVVFVVYVDPDLRKPGNFGSVRDAYVHLTDRQSNEIVRFDLPNPDLSITAMIFGELYRYKEEWKFRAIGQGYTTGLSGVAKDYKVSL